MLDFCVIPRVNTTYLHRIFMLYLVSNIAVHVINSGLPGQSAPAIDTNDGWWGQVWLIHKPVNDLNMVNLLNPTLT